MTTSTLCVIVRDEQSVIAEWIAYHTLIGFDHIMIYDNDSKDKTKEIIEGISKKCDRISYRLWRDTEGRRPQHSAYNDAYRKCGTEWIAFFDADEFLVLHEPKYINDYLDQVDAGISAIAVNWLLFGSSGREEPGDGLLIERFLMCGYPNHGKHKFCKAICRTDRIEVMHPHAADIKWGRYVTVDFKDTVLEARAKTSEPKLYPAHLNHYMLKSKKEYLDKINRGNVTHTPGERSLRTKFDDEYWKAHDVNQREHTVILKRLQGVKSLMSDWGVL